MSILSTKPAIAIAMLLGLSAVFSANASTTMKNPVTGADETYKNTFTGGTDGTGTEWNNADNWDRDADVNAAAPYISSGNNGNYNASLVDGKTASTATSIDGWNLQVGAYNGASITWNPLGKIQGDTTMWLTVDGTSSIAINRWGSGNLGQSGKNLNYYVAAQNGVTWGVDLASGTDQGLTMNYYLAGNGSVSYQALGKATHVIKQADVTLSGNAKSVQSKTLVSFTSSSVTFTAAADIKVKNSSGDVLETLSLTSVTSGTTTLTGSEAVGTCEIVQTSTGIVLYYVDGDPDAIVAKTYKPSININFCHGNAPLTTAADVGYGDYAVPGTSWNNMVSAGGDNGTFTTPLSTIYGIDSTGAQKAISGASVAVSGTRGSWSCSSLTAASDLRNGYVDESSSGTTPTVTVSGIPYDQYKVVVYTATDSANVKFGYITVNGTNYTYSEGALTEGTSDWGNSGAADSADAIAEGVNTLVTPAISGATLTVVGHRGSSSRGCIAAIQVVEVLPELGENDLRIYLDGDETYTFTEAKAYSGTVYVLGSGTLTFAGTASTATTLHIGPSAAVNMNGSTLTPSAVTGNGTAIYTGATPATGLGWTDSANWTGTLWVKNHSSFSGVVPNTMANAKSTLRLSGVVGYFNNGDSKQTCDGTLELENDSYSYAFSIDNGYSTYGITVFAKLKGSGTLGVQSRDIAQRYVFKDASEFTGTFSLAGRPLRVILGNGETLSPDNGTITIVSGATATVASGATWTANQNGFRVEGTLNVNGTLASSAETAAIKGSGTVVFTGRAPTPVDGENETKWWKNAAWTGTVTIKNGAIGEMTFNNYGNTGSTLELIGVTGYLTERNATIVAPTLKLTDGTGDYVFGFKSNNGWSDNACTIRKLTGSGKFMGVNNPNGNNVTQHYIVQDGSEFTGSIDLGKRSMAFGSTTTKTSNKIVIDAGQSITIASGKTWTSSIGELSVDVNGTLTNSGTVTIGSANNSSAVIAIGATGSVVNNYSVCGYGAMTIAEGGRFETALDNGCWFVKGITINGTFVAADLSKWGSSTTTTVGDTGVLTLVSNSIKDDMNVDYTRIQGTGTLKFEGSAYRCISTNNFPTAMIVENNLTAGLLHRIPNLEVTIGSLSGSGYLRSDWGGSASDRSLKVLQAKDTTWSGKFWTANPHRFGTLRVAPGASTAGTLTISATHEAEESTALQVDSGASVNLTGTWVGNTTVSGTFGGTGTLTGNLTFNAGATFKAFVSDENGLAVSGTIAYPSGGKVTVDVSALTETTGKVVLMTATAANVTLDAAKFALASGQNGELLVEGNALKVDLTTYVASYGGTKYETIAAAIAAAVADSHTYEDVTILDSNATCPAGYYIDTENNNALKMYQAAIIQNNVGVISTNYFKTAQLAVDAIEANVQAYQKYTHFEVYSGTEAEMSINLSATVWSSLNKVIKVKCLNGATVAVTFTSDEYTLSASTADEDGIVTYAKTAKAATYVWVAASQPDWYRPTNWKVGSAEGATASRAPGSTDTVVFSDGANVTGVSGALSVAALQVSGAVTFTGGGSLTSASPITLGVGDSITITGTLSPVPTTAAAGYCVKAAVSDSTTTYTVEALSIDKSVGYIEVTTAVITNTSAAVTIPDGVTAITVYLDGGNPVLSGSMAMFAQNANSISFRVKYGQSGDQLVTRAFPSLALVSPTHDGDVYTFTLSLDANGTVPVGNENIAVTPALDTSATPIAAGTSTASFTVKTIPGLYYAVGYGSDNSTFKAQSGTVVQATSTTTTLTAPTGDFSGIRYYKIQVGVSSTDFEVYPAAPAE